MAFALAARVNVLVLPLDRVFLNPNNKFCSSSAVQLINNYEHIFVGLCKLISYCSMLKFTTLVNINSYGTVRELTKYTDVLKVK